MYIDKCVSIYFFKFKFFSGLYKNTYATTFKLRFCIALNKNESADTFRQKIYIRL